MSKAINAVELSNILTHNLMNAAFTEKLTEQEIDFLKNLVGFRNDIVTNIVESINAILQDGVLDVKDIPSILVLMTNLMKVYYSSKDFVNIRVVSILRFLLDSILGIVPLNTEEVVVIQSVVDASLSLLEMTFDEKSSVWKRITSFFNKLFTRSRAVSIPV